MCLLGVELLGGDLDILVTDFLLSLKNGEELRLIAAGGHRL